MPDCQPFTIKSHGPSHTHKIGASIGRAAQPGDVILLTGNLGAGKTCLTQGIARGLKVEQPVQSPTFVLAREMKGRIPLYHIDLYRLDNIDEIADLGLDEYFFGQGLTVVEWADKGLWLLPENGLSVTIEIKGETERVFRFVPSNKHYMKMATRIKELA